MAQPTKRRVSTHTRGAIGSKAGLQFGPDQWLMATATAPSNGASGDGAGFAGPGSICTAIDTGELYTNTGTKASPTWTNQT